MPAYELREHLPTHGYDVVGRYASPDDAAARRRALIAEDPRRLGHYTIDYVHDATPDAALEDETPQEEPSHAAIQNDPTGRLGGRRHQARGEEGQR